MSRETKPKLAHAQCSIAKDPTDASSVAIHNAPVFAVTPPAFTQDHLLVQIPDFAKLIQTPDIQVGRK